MSAECERLNYIIRHKRCFRSHCYPFSWWGDTVQLEAECIKVVHTSLICNMDIADIYSENQWKEPKLALWLSYDCCIQLNVTARQWHQIKPLPEGWQGQHLTSTTSVIKYPISGCHLVVSLPEQDDFSMCSYLFETTKYSPAQLLW